MHEFEMEEGSSFVTAYSRPLEQFILPVFGRQNKSFASFQCNQEKILLQGG